MLFKYVLRLEKPPMVFDPQNAPSGYIVVPLNKGLFQHAAAEGKNYMSYLFSTNRKLVVIDDKLNNNFKGGTWNWFTGNLTFFI